MQQVKRFIFVPLMMVLLFVGVSPNALAATTYSDVPSNDWAAKEIYYLSEQGVLKGKNNRLFDRDANVTRAEAAAILVRAKNLSLSGVPDPGFKDVPKSSHFYKEIAAAVNAGWFQKADKFNPAAPLKRVDMAKITALSFDIRGSVPVDWEDMGKNYHGNAYITPLLANGITSGFTATTFKPSDFVTRAQMAVFTARAIAPEYRLKVISYPKHAGDGIYYPQFKDSTNKNNFSYLNSYIQAEGQKLVKEKQSIRELSLEDDMMGEFYTFDTSYKITRSDLNFISVLFEGYTYTGGAHGIAHLFSYNYDVKNERIISLHDLATKSGYEDKIIQRINSMNSEFYPQFGGPKNLDELQNQFYMTPTNFVMFLNPYEYAPYAAGIREFSMPYSWIR